MREITLHMVDDSASRTTMYNDNEEGEGVGVAPVIIPVHVNVDAIRCRYPRKHGRPGSRITFTDGGGFAVMESDDDITAMLALMPAA